MTDAAESYSANPKLDIEVDSHATKANKQVSASKYLHVSVFDTFFPLFIVFVHFHTFS